MKISSGVSFFNKLYGFLASRSMAYIISFSSSENLTLPKAVTLLKYVVYSGGTT